MSKNRYLYSLVFQITKKPKTLFLIPISVSGIFTTYLLYRNISFHSLKISYYYLLAKFCTGVGIEDFNISISGSFGVVFTRKAVDVVGNFYVVEIFNDTLKTLWISIVTGLFWAMFSLVILVLLFGVKIWWESGKRRLLNLRKMKKDITNHKWQPTNHQKIEKEQNIAPAIKVENADVKKKSPSKSKNYRLISDKNLPYPIIKKVVLVEPEE